MGFDEDESDQPKHLVSLNREAVATQSPGLPGFAGNPGNRDTGSQPRRGCAGFSLPVVCAALGLAQPRWGWITSPSFPRVAAKARQPWALGRNRFAVKRLGLTFLKYITFDLY